MAKLSDMANIGKEIEKKLISVGIDTPDRLKEAGAKEAFARLKEAYPNVCTVFLYCLEGAITNTEYNKLSKEKRDELQDFSNRLK